MTELWCPFARAEPTGNHGGPMEPNVIGMVHHVTAGPNDPGPWFQNPASQASSHFGIDTDGTLYQYVDMLLASWAQAAGNYSYWSVEVVGDPSTPDTDQQVATFGRLYAWCSAINEMSERAAFGFTLAEAPGQYGLGWHGMGGDGWGGHYGCPGDLRKAQRPRILAVAEGAPQPQENDMPAPSDIVRHIDLGNGHFMHLFAGGAIALTPGTNLPDYHMVATTGEIYAFGPSRNPSIPDYAHLPDTYKNVPRTFYDAWLG